MSAHCEETARVELLDEIELRASGRWIVLKRLTYPDGGAVLQIVVSRGEKSFGFVVPASLVGRLRAALDTFELTPRASPKFGRGPVSGRTAP